MSLWEEGLAREEAATAEAEEDPLPAAFAPPCPPALDPVDGLLEDVAFPLTSSPVLMARRETGGIIVSSLKDLMPS